MKTIKILRRYNRFKKLFHEIGLAEAKHKTYIEVFNVYRIEQPSFGNPEKPFGIQEIKKGAPTHQDSQKGDQTQET